MLTPELAELATGHAQSRFADDMASRDGAIREALSDRRVLLIGGAGSIGSSTLRAMVRFGPASVHVIDHDENGLAELARDLRSSGRLPRDLDLRLMPLDYGSGAAQRFINEAGPYDAVLHFAALKHVRSEKDLASILQMVDTNVLKQLALVRWLAETKPPARYFAVSTDKAANPANFMGASKRLMEHVLFTDGVADYRGMTRNSARFANVAFSAGSLLESWSERLRRQQPVAVPRDTRRYFVSLDEAAEICLLAAICLPDRHLAVPSLHGRMEARELVPIADAFVRAQGYTPAHYEDEKEARDAMRREPSSRRWPVLVTPRDTDGEKETEEFVGKGERETDVGLLALRSVAQAGADPATLREVLDSIARLVSDASVRSTKEALAALIARVVPEFEHAQSGRSLDSRM